MPGPAPNVRSAARWKTVSLPSRLIFVTLRTALSVMMRASGEPAPMY